MGLTPESATVALAGMPSSDSVRELERHLLQLPQIDLGTQMLVHGGVCTRAILIPAGCCLTGALTNLPNTCIVLGDITVTTEHGVRRITGFEVLPAAPGAKRAGIAHADTWWVTCHHTDLTDVAEIEDEMTPEPEMLQTRRQALGNNAPPALEG
jgi:hypothetical protein